jgi:TolB-like protein/DNA-binding winged helix-turn-helix (wHTH) protein
VRPCRLTNMKSAGSEAEERGKLASKPHFTGQSGDRMGTAVHMSSQAIRYRFGDLVLDSGLRRVERDGHSLHLGKLTYEMLLALVEAAPNVVTQDFLAENVWGGRIATPETVAQRVKLLRRALEDDSGQPRYIEVVRGHGYRLIPQVEFEYVTPGHAISGTSVSAGAPASTRTRRWIIAGSFLLAAGLGAFLWWSARERQMETLTPNRPPAQAAGNSIAVLPFVDLSERRDQQYLSDGITEDILDRLANKRGGLRVIARTSSFAFRDRALDITEIAAKLKVSHILEGSVRRSGKQLRVTAQLVHAADGSHVWSQTFDRTVDDLFAVQDDIATSVAAALHVALAESRTERPPSSVAAHEDYLQGRYLHWRRAPGDPALAVRYFESAVARDPEYALAWAGLAGAYTVMWLEEGLDPAIWRRKQGEAARKAVELDPNLVDARLRLAGYYFYTSKWRQRIEEHRSIMALDPSRAGFDPTVWHGDLEAAVLDSRTGVEEDPYSALARLNLGLLLFATGRLEEASTEFRKVLELSPNAGWDRELEFARVLVAQKRYDEAYASILRLAPDGRDFGLALLHAAPGMTELSDSALARLQARSGDKMHAIRIAEALCMRGRYDEAFATLYRARDSLERDEAILSRLWFFQNELLVSPFLGPLHPDRRWQALVAMPEGDSAEEIIERLWPASPTIADNRPH